VSVLVYAFTDPDPPAIEGTGLSGQPLRLVKLDDVAAVVSDHDAARLECTGPNLWDFEQVMERLMQRGAIVPARFGTVLADDDVVRALVRDGHEELTRGLGQVRGAVELGTRVRWRVTTAPAAPIPAPRNGSAYMTSRVKLHQRARELAQRLDPLAELARDVRVRLAEDDEFPVHEAYLVDRDSLARFTDAIRRLDQREPDIELVCTGPWPPYSFARAVDLTGRAVGGVE
jgi:hypothetical protein